MNQSYQRQFALWGIECGLETPSEEYMPTSKTRSRYQVKLIIKHNMTISIMFLFYYFSASDCQHLFSYALESVATSCRVAALEHLPSLARVAAALSNGR